MGPTTTIAVFMDGWMEYSLSGGRYRFVLYQILFMHDLGLSGVRSFMHDGQLAQILFMHESLFYSSCWRWCKEQPTKEWMEYLFLVG